MTVKTFDPGPDHSWAEWAERKGFGDYYRWEIAPGLRKQQQKHDEARRWVSYTRIPAFVGFFFVMWLVFWLDWNTDPILWTAIAYICISPVVVNWPLFQLQSDVQSFVASKVISFFGLDYRRSPSVESLKVLRHFAESFPMYYAKHLKPVLQDEIRGEHNGVPFHLVECSLGISDSSVFDGLIFSFQFPRSFGSQTVVLADYGRINDWMVGKQWDLKRVPLENPRFEKLFTAWSNDPIEARSLLTWSFTERIADLVPLVGGKSRVALSLRDERLLLTVKGGNKFEAGHKDMRVDDRRRVDDLLTEIRLVFDIIDILAPALRP